MKKQLLFICFLLLCIQAMAQSVSIEPGVSLFNNSSTGTEIRAEHTRPLKISAEGHLAPVDFYNYTQLHGRIRSSYSTMQIHAKNGVLLFPTIDSTLGPKFNLNASGKLVLADNAYNGLYRLNVLENDENVAFFGNTNIDGNTVINLNNQSSFTSSPNDLKIAGHADVSIESNTFGSFKYRTVNTNRFVINGTNGNVGIGTSTPAYPLHIEAKKDTVVKFKNTLNNFSNMVLHDQLQLSAGKITDNGVQKNYGTIRTNGFFFLQTQDQQHYNVNGNYAMRIDQSGDVTIRPTYSGTDYLAAKARLDVGGTLRSQTLDFAETTLTERRPVFADKDGILRIGNSSNQYISYNFSSVQSQNWDDQLRRGSGYAWFNTTNTGGTMYLPVNLPDGVKVTNVRMYVLDNSASDISFTFSRNTHTSNTFTTLALATSSSASPSVRYINGVANETINNLDNSYYVNISSAGNWTGDTLRFHSLVITYQY